MTTKRKSSKYQDFRLIFIGYGNHRLCRWRCPVKSFSFKHRAKRATNSNSPIRKKVSLERQFARLRAVGQVMQVK